MTAAPSASQPDRRTLIVGKGWIQAVALVVIFGFFVMGIPRLSHLFAVYGRCSAKVGWQSA
jgi:hypothetical protein